MRGLVIGTAAVLFATAALSACAQNRSDPFNTGGTTTGLSQASTSPSPANRNGIGNRPGQGQSTPGNPQQHQGPIGRSAENVRENADIFSRKERRQASFDFVVDNLNEMRNERKRWQSRRNQAPKVRVRFVPAFDYPKLSPIAIGTKLQKRIDALPARNDTASLRVELNDRAAILRGIVSSEHERALLGRLVSLEPGVSSVENLLTISAK